MSSSARLPDSCLVELCAGGVDDVHLAAQFGVDRIELNSGMAVGGLTPSVALTAAARRIFTRPIIAMVRPREGGFAYSRVEYLQMLNDAELLVASGIEGIATGFLSGSGDIDVDRCRKLRALLPHAVLVFHKAFDVTPNPDVALSQLIDCGFNRILSSGGMPTAVEGATMLKHLHQKADGRIEILPAGGVRAANVVNVIEQTGCNQIHSAVTEIAADSSTQHNSRLHFGLPGRDNGSYGRASADQLQALLSAVKHLRHTNPGTRDA